MWLKSFKAQTALEQRRSREKTPTPEHGVQTFNWIRVSLILSWYNIMPVCPRLLACSSEDDLVLAGLHPDC